VALPRNPDAAWLAASCLTATDSGTLEDLLESLKQRMSGQLSHLLQFEAALSTVTSLLWMVLRHLLAGVVAAETLGSHLLAVIFLVVLIDLVLQSVVMQQLLPRLRPAGTAEAG
jgi:NhaP-type Na+/H+ or K+/H+ antiporter